MRGHGAGLARSIGGASAALMEKRRRDSDAEDRHDHDQRQRRRQCIDVAEAHLDSDEDEDRGQPVAQEAEPVEHPGEQEVEREHAEHREGVGRENEEWVVGDREDRRHRVGGEGYVGRCDGKQDCEHRRRRQPPVHSHEEPLPVVARGHRHHSAQRAHDDVAVGMRLDIADCQPSPVTRRKAPDVDHPRERLECGRADRNEGGTQDQGSDDPPEKRAMAVPVRNGEVREDHRQHEHVVDRQTALDHVAGQISVAAPPPRHHQTTPANATASTSHTAVHAAASRTRTSNARRWNTSKSTSSTASTAATKTTHTQTAATNYLSRRLPKVSPSRLGPAPRARASRDDEAPGVDTPLRASDGTAASGARTARQY